MKTGITTVVLLCWSLFLFAADMTLEIIPLNHRLTDEVIPVLRPLLVPGGTLTGMNNQLIIKTTSENLAQIRSVLESLDHSPRKLLISVKQDVDGQLHQRGQSVSGRYSTGDVEVEAGDPGHGHHDSVVITGGDEDGNNIRYRYRDSHTDSQDRNTFTVQATEGYPAHITTGSSVPVETRTAYLTRRGVVVNDSVEYVDAESGFYVLPRLNGNQVTLLVAPRLTRVAPGKSPVFDTQNVETTATGMLGEWIELGGINQDFNRQGRDGFSSSDTQGQEMRSVLIKVDEIK